MTTMATAAQPTTMPRRRPLPNERNPCPTALVVVTKVFVIQVPPAYRREYGAANQQRYKIPSVYAVGILTNNNCSGVSIALFAGAAKQDVPKFRSTPVLRAGVPEAGLQI